MIKEFNNKFKDVKLFKVSSFSDPRGSFSEVYNNEIKDIIDSEYNFVQDNESFSNFGTLRGLHYQKDEFAQGKLIRVTYGKIQDVIVDLRKKSSTFGKWESFELSKENNTMLYIPRGFAHGFLVLSKFAIVNYKADNYYNQKSESGILFNDQNLNIKWSLSENKMLISSKDKKLPNFSNEDF